jgi:type I restriction enzyme S subunit
VFLGITSLNKGRIDLAASDHVSEEDFAKWTRRVTPRPGDVVFSYETKLGEAAIIPEGLRCCLGRRMGLMRPDPKRLESRFLLYYYLGPEFQDVIRERTIHGSTVERLALIEFPKFPLRIPPLPEQKAIAAVLGALDDKIELNRRMNATLEAMARALFRSWFIDFDPVRANMDRNQPSPGLRPPSPTGRGAGGEGTAGLDFDPVRAKLDLPARSAQAGGRQPAGLDKATADLFPEHFAHGEDGMLPFGWSYAAIEALCDINAWTLGKNDDLETLEYVEISEVSRGNIASIATYARGEEPSRARRRLRHGDTVLSTVRPDRGSYFLALNPPENRVASTGFAVLTPTKVPWSFLHAALTMPEVSDHLGQMADGGAYPAVRPEIIGTMKIAVPNEPKILDAFHRTCAPLFEQAEANRAQSRTLATLRDTLLPKLLSGELSVAQTFKESANV